MPKREIMGALTIALYCLTGVALCILLAGVIILPIAVMMQTGSASAGALTAVLYIVGLTLASWSLDHDN